MDRQYMPYWPPGPGQYPPGPGQNPPIKEEPDYSKMGYEDGPVGGFGIKREPNLGYEEPPPMAYGANIKQEPPPMRGYGASVKQELPAVKQEYAEPVEPKREPEERRGEKRQAGQYSSPDPKRYRSASDQDHVEDEPEYDKDAVLLDWYNSDLSLLISKDDFLSAEPLTSQGFAYVWHGVRATYGFLRGRIFFEVKVLDHLPVPELEANEQHPHVVRVGWSVDDSGMTLGEEPLGYGYGGTAKASTNLKFKDYGRPFGKGDVVGCFLDMDSEPIVMSFTLNGRNLGMCYEVSHRALQGRALFPHILTKNCSFKVNFGGEYPWFQPLSRYTFVGQVPLKERVLGTQAPALRQDAEVIMMIGLPACGKTTWVEKYCKEHPEKKFYVLGTNFLIDKMKVNGLPRKRNYHGRWDELIGKCTQGLNKLLEMAYKRRRNFIVDQTNVYASARRRKMKGFPGFFRRAVVVCPNDAELKSRTEKQVRIEGKSVPDSAVMEMKANFTLPEGEEDLFDAVDYVDLPLDEATKLVEQYSRDAQNAGFVKKSNNRGGRGGGNFRGGWNRDRRGGFNDRSDRGGLGGGQNSFGGSSRGGHNRDSFGGRDRDGSSRDSSMDRGSQDYGRGNQDFGHGSDNGSRGGRGFDRRGGFSNNRGFGRGGGGTFGGNKDGPQGGGYGMDRDGPPDGFGTDRDSRSNSGMSNRGGFGHGRFGSMNRDSRFNDGPNGSPSGRGGYSRFSDGPSSSPSIQGGYGRGNFSRDGQQSYGADRDNQGGNGSPAGRYGSDNFGSGNRDYGERDTRGNDNNSFGGHNRDSYNSQGSYNNRGFNSDRDRDGRDNYSRDSYGGNSSRGGNFDNSNRSMGNQWGGYSSNQDYGDSSSYRGQGGSSGGGGPSVPNYGNDWNKPPNQPPQWGQSNRSYGSQGSDMYGGPSDRDSGPSGSSGPSGGGWDQQRSGGGPGNQSWNYDSNYRGPRP